MSEAALNDHQRLARRAEDVFNETTPPWLRRAMSLYADHNISPEETDLRGQYTENRMFLRRVELDRQQGRLPGTVLLAMEESFAKSCADPAQDPLLALEEIYLKHHDARQAQASRRRPSDPSAFGKAR